MNCVGAVKGLNMSMTMTVNIDQALEDRLFDGLETKGFICLENVINPAFLAKCQGEVDRLLAERGERFFSVIQPQHREGGAFREMVDTPGFEPLLRRIARRSHSETAVADFELYNVLRVIGGKEAAKGAFEFHYDATVLTVLMPLYIPDGAPGTTGELVAMPNRRGYRSSSVINVIEKALMQNSLAFRYYARRYAKPNKNVQILKPGNLYFFNGYRTFHGNLPCTSGQKRATLIFHYGDPHAGSGLTNIILRLRKLREERRLRAA